MYSSVETKTVRMVSDPFFYVLDNNNFVVNVLT